MDTLGGYDDAVKAAALLAKLPAGYAVERIEPEMTWAEELAMQLHVRMARIAGKVAGPSLGGLRETLAPLAQLAPMQRELANLQRHVTVAPGAGLLLLLGASKRLMNARSGNGSGHLADDRATRLFVALAGFFIVDALLAEFVGVKIFSLELTLGTPPCTGACSGFRERSTSPPASSTGRWCSC